ncbi:MAG: hypothetical protein U9O94_10180 [Nanoarchaeota archaeon]|nr:hypothetical protein [Nanoarchaeota archaeon]
MASAIYNGFKKGINDNIDWVNDNIKCILVTSNYIQNVDSHVYYSDIVDEVTGSGYTTGGIALPSTSISINTTDDLAEYRAGYITWNPADITALGAIIYKDTGISSTSLLISYSDFGVVKVSINGSFRVSWISNIVFKLA